MTFEAAERARKAVARWLASLQPGEGLVEAGCVEIATLKDAWASVADGEGGAWEEPDEAFSVEGGVRCQSAVDPSQLVPAWFWATAAGRAWQCPANVPATAARVAAAAAAGARQAANVAFTVGTLVGIGAAVGRRRSVPAPEAAWVAAQVAQWARRLAEEAAGSGR